MLIGYMRVSSDNDRQTTDLQRDALIQAGVDERHLLAQNERTCHERQSSIFAVSG
jgi:hypothetical protein